MALHHVAAASHDYCSPHAHATDISRLTVQLVQDVVFHVFKTGALQKTWKGYVSCCDAQAMFQISEYMELGVLFGATPQTVNGKGHSLLCHDEP
jgi:hypothetical protein